MEQPSVIPHARPSWPRPSGYRGLYRPPRSRPAGDDATIPRRRSRCTKRVRSPMGGPGEGISSASLRTIAARAMPDRRTRAFSSFPQRPTGDLHEIAFSAPLSTCAAPACRGCGVRRRRAASAKPEDAIKYRKATMTLAATHFRAHRRHGNGRIPFDAKVAADNADMLAMVSKWQFTWVRRGSDKGRHQGQARGLDRGCQDHRRRPARVRTTSSSSSWRSGRQPGCDQGGCRAGRPVVQGCHDTFRR